MHELTPLTGPVSPVEALRRIATLMERQRAGSYRIEAFRSAMARLAGLDEDEVASRASAGTLTDLRHYVGILDGRRPAPDTPFFDVERDASTRSVSGLIAEALRRFLRGEVEEKYPTATLAELAIDAPRWADLAAGGGRLLRFTRPRDLDPSLGPDES